MLRGAAAVVADGRLGYALIGATSWDSLRA
jgi:hypothetical protein